MKRVYIPIREALKQAKEINPMLGTKDGLCACYDIEDMGFCKDGVTRWYHFIAVDGKPAYTFKR